MRTEFTERTKDRAYERSQGMCEGCGLPLQKGRIRYDHRIPDWMGGDNTLSNCQVLGWCCDAPKTARDQTDIARAKKRIRRERGIKKKAKRPFTRWRNMRGEIVNAKKER